METVNELSNQLTKLELLPIGDTSTLEKLLAALTIKVEELINHQFQYLVQLLYRIDVSEDKLKALLNAEHSSSASIIAKAIIDRLMEKIEVRNTFKSDIIIPEEDRW